MTETESGVKLMPGPITTPLAKKVKKNTFTVFQSVILILLTALVTAGGWYAVGKFYVWPDMDMKRANQQLDYYKQKVAAEPNKAGTRVDLGYTYFLLGKNTEAIRELNQALVLDPKSFDAYYNLGLVMLGEKRYNEALQKFTKAVELSPRDYKGYLQEGITYRNLGMYQEAKDALTKADKLMPTNADIVYEIARVAEAQGEKETAITIYKDVLTYDPLYKPAIESLQRLEKK